MKSLMSCVILVTLFICLSVKRASSIECYSCKSTENEICRHFYWVLTKKCPDSDLCGIKQYGDEIERSCIIEDDDEESGEDDEDYDGRYLRKGMSVCNRDLCNGGAMTKFQMATLIVSAILSLTFHYKI